MEASNVCSTVAETPIDFRRPRYFYHGRKEEEEEEEETTKKIVSGSGTRYIAVSQLSRSW